MKKRKTAGMLSLAMAIIMVFSLFMPETTALGVTLPNSGIVRVLLSTPSSTSMSMTATAAYSVKEASLQVNAGSFTVSIVDGVLAVTTGGATTQIGSKITLVAQEGATIKLTNSLYGSQDYLGDMEFTMNSGFVRVINYLPLEKYLYGVVPYEMSNSWPVEALKAQAVCARGYVISHMSTSGTYDVTDTSSYQVYKGYESSYTNSNNAVNATSGQVLTYGGSIANTYYSASNGGQTELPQNVWVSSLPYCVMKDDPYDLRNPYSMQELSFIPQAFNTETIGLMDDIVYNKLLDGAKAALSADSIALVSTESITPNTPKYPAPSRCYTKADVAMTVQTETGTHQVTVSLALDDLIYSASANPNGIFNKEYNMRMRGVEAATKTSGGTTYQGWNLTNRRWGHGIGMSQRGAEQMAREGLAYNQILAFYFDGTAISSVSAPADGTSISTSYTLTSGNLKGVAEKTDAAALLGNVSISNGSASLLDKNSQAKTSGIVCTGDILHVVRSDGSLYGNFSVILCGDVDGDGQISLLDLLKVQKHLLGTSTLSNAYYSAGDVDGNGSITLLDLLKVQKHLLGTSRIA